METTSIKAKQRDAMISLINTYDNKESKTEKDRKKLIAHLSHLKDRFEKELSICGL